MDRKTIIAAAGALVLTVVGAVSALSVALAGAFQGGAATAAATADPPAVMTEYVDQAGNPISGPDAVVAPAPQTVILPVYGQASDATVVSAAGDSSAATDSVLVAPASPNSVSTGHDHEAESENEGYDD
jgi:hypothetical protein